MEFSFFSKSGTRVSRRLRAIGAVFQFWGLLAGAMLLPMYLSMSRLARTLPPAERERFGLRSIMTYAGFAVSYFLIGRALRRRDRWGAYLALLTLAGPLVVRVLTGVQIKVGPFDTALNIAGLVLIASAWKELHPAAGGEVELDDVDDPDDDTPPLTPRNRGYGEPRSLPLNGVPGTVGTSEREPIESRTGT